MSYSYSFTQYPEKDFDELVEEFMNGKLSARVNDVLANIDVQEKEAAKLNTFSKATFYEDREAWIQCERNRWAQEAIQSEKRRWIEIQTRISESEQSLRNTRDKRKLKQIATSFVTMLTDIAVPDEAIGLAFIPDCTSIFESARDRDYCFLVQLFKSIMHLELDGMKAMPTNEQWKSFVLALKSNVLKEEFQKFCIEERISEEEREPMHQYCLKLLFQVKDMLKTCLLRGWVLLFSSEYWNSDLREKVLKEKRKIYIQRIVDRFSSSSS
jgi:hypothetical protein